DAGAPCSPRLASRSPSVPSDDFGSVLPAHAPRPDAVGRPLVIRMSRRGGSAAFVLEAELHLGAVGADLPVLELDVELRDLGDAQVAQRLRRLVDGRRGGLLP